MHRLFVTAILPCTPALWACCCTCCAPRAADPRPTIRAVPLPEPGAWQTRTFSAPWSHHDRPPHHFRHHAARRRTEPRRLDDEGREASHRQAAGATARRRHRGRVRGVVQRRLRGGALDRGRGEGLDRVLAGPRQRPRHRARRRSARAGEDPAHPHLHRDLAAAHGEEAAHDAGPGVRAGEARRALRAPVHRRRRVLARGRLPLGAGLPLPGARGRDRRGRDHDQHPGHGRLRRAGAVRQVPARPAHPDSQLGQGGLERALPQRSRDGGRQLARRRDDRRRAPGRVHRSTASASAPATARSRRS